MLFTFYQNNSGGSFAFNENDGITHYVIIEADSAEEANKKAQSIGIYFDGCEEGMDCDCCGDRWYYTDDSDGEAKPTIYGEDFNKVELTLWMDEGKNICVHYKSGEKVWA